jgi:hypothetical protein
MQRASLCAVCTALALAAGVSSPARADWTGVVKIRIDPPPPMGPPQDGRIFGKGGKVRFEMTGRMGKAAVIFDGSAKKRTLILEERRGYMVADFDEPVPGRGFAVQLGAACEGADPTPCLELAGFRKSGAEQVNEKVNWQKTTKWSREQKSPLGLFHQDLWTVDGFKEFAFVRQVSKLEQRTVTVDIEGLKKAPQPDALFKVPVGFTDLGKRRGPGGRARPPPERPDEQ